MPQLNASETRIFVLLQEEHHKLISGETIQRVRVRPDLDPPVDLSNLREALQLAHIDTTTMDDRAGLSREPITGATLIEVIRPASFTQTDKKPRPDNPASPTEFTDLFEDLFGFKPK